METARLVLEYIQTLVWPALLVAAAIWLNEDVRKFLGRLKSAEGLGVRVELAEQKAKEIDATLQDNTKPVDERVRVAQGSAEELLELLNDTWRQENSPDGNRRWSLPLHRQ